MLRLRHLVASLCSGYRVSEIVTCWLLHNRKIACECTKAVIKNYVNPSPDRCAARNALHVLMRRKTTAKHVCVPSRLTSFCSENARETRRERERKRERWGGRKREAEGKRDRTLIGPLLL